MVVDPYRDPDRILQPGEVIYRGVWKRLRGATPDSAAWFEQNLGYRAGAAISLMPSAAIAAIASDMSTL